MNLSEVECKMESDIENEKGSKDNRFEPDIKDVLISIIKLQSSIEQFGQRIGDLKEVIDNNTSLSKGLIISKSDTVIQKIDVLNKQTDSIPVLTHRLIEKSIKDFDDVEKLKNILNNKIETAGTLIYFLLGIVAVNTLLIIYILFFI